MFGMKAVPFTARRRESRPGSTAVLALWVLLSLLSNATPVLCLDGAGECAPAAAAKAAPCHDQAAGGDFTPSCGSCVDIIVPDDSLAHANRPDHDLQTPVTAQSLGDANDVFIVRRATIAAAPPIGSVPLRPVLRTTVLLI